MPPYESSMSSLLFALKARLEDSVGHRGGGGGSALYPTLKQIKQFRVGPLTPSAVFPAVTIVPVSQQIVHRYSGGRVTLQRTFRAYCYAKTLQKEKAREDLQGVLRDVKEVIQTQYSIPDHMQSPQTFSHVAGATVLEGVAAPKVSALWEGHYTFSLLSKLRFEPRVPNLASSVLEGKIDSVMDAIEATFRNNTTFDLPEFSPSVGADMKFWQIPVVPKFPCLAVVQSEEVSDERFAGADEVGRGFTAIAYNRFGHLDKALTDMLDLSERVMAFLWKYNRMGGYATDTEMGVISYGLAQEDTALIYQSLIPFVCRCREAVRYTGVL